MCHHVVQHQQGVRTTGLSSRVEEVSTPLLHLVATDTSTAITLTYQTTWCHMPEMCKINPHCCRHPETFL
jgi:hypothetical protein